MLSSPRIPAKKMRIFSSAKQVCRFSRRMFLSYFSASALLLPDISFIFIP